MTREEAIERYDRIRYNLLNHDDKEAVDIAFEALREQDVTDTNVGRKTNADHIRSMSDEELATTIYSVFGIDDSKIPFCKNKPECDELLDADKEIPESMCLRCMLAWIKQPYKEDEVG